MGLKLSQQKPRKKGEADTGAGRVESTVKCESSGYTDETIPGQDFMVYGYHLSKS